MHGEPPARRAKRASLSLLAPQNSELRDAERRELVDMKENTLYKGVLLMIVCACCLCAGQFIWKCGDGLLPLFSGFVIYGMGALAMLAAYRFGSVSSLQPINSVSYVISAVLGYFAFQEPVTVGKIVGIAAIMSGVILLARGDAS